ncbi:MAG TPA: stalk domain-containing protein, partial [Anaerovoracaceae bacterium]|nr:stalk domain-containing protein [Anaerovoracaceae bacterium]
FTVTDYVSSESSPVLHIWNAVYIDEEWLHVDPTWNDATRNSDYPNGRYFLLPVDEIILDRQTMSLDTEEDYNDFYKFIKTISLSLETTDPERCSLQGNRILVPLYETAYALGGYVKQDDNNEVTIILDAKILNLTIGSHRGLMDGEEFDLDVAPQIINGTIMVPVRLVFEKLGAEVSFDSITSLMTIDYDPYRTK